MFCDVDLSDPKSSSVSLRDFNTSSSEEGIGTARELWPAMRNEGCEVPTYDPIDFMIFHAEESEQYVRAQLGDSFNDQAVSALVLASQNRREVYADICNALIRAEVIGLFSLKWGVMCS